MNTAGIGKVIAVLEEMQRVGIIRRYAIGGAFAAILYDEPVSTIDLDIFFLLTKSSDSAILSLSEIYEFAKDHGFSFDHEFINIHGWLVQFVESSHNSLWKVAIEDARLIVIEGISVPVISPEYLIAMWLFAGRTKDYQKIAAFLESGILEQKKLDYILERHDLLLKWKKESFRFTTAHESE